MKRKAPAGCRGLARRARRPTNMRCLRHLAVALCRGGRLPACRAAQTPPRNQAATPPEAGYVDVRAEPVLLDVDLAGRVAAFEVSEVRPQVSGVIQARLFTEGAMVEAGQTLYR